MINHTHGSITGLDFGDDNEDDFELVCFQGDRYGRRRLKEGEYTRYRNYPVTVRMTQEEKQQIIDAVYEQVMTSLSENTIEVEDLDSMNMGQGTMSLSLSEDNELKKSKLYDAVRPLLDLGVRYIPQTTLEAQKQVARENIDALGVITEEEFFQIFN